MHSNERARPSLLEKPGLLHGQDRSETSEFVLNDYLRAMGPGLSRLIQTGAANLTTVAGESPFAQWLFQAPGLFLEPYNALYRHGSSPITLETLEVLLAPHVDEINYFLLTNLTSQLVDNAEFEHAQYATILEKKFPGFWIFNPSGRGGGVFKAVHR